MPHNLLTPSQPTLHTAVNDLLTLLAHTQMHTTTFSPLEREAQRRLAEAIQLYNGTLARAPKSGPVAFLAAPETPKLLSGWYYKLPGPSGVEWHGPFTSRASARAAWEHALPRTKPALILSQLIARRSPADAR